ncbi:MAG: flagellar biosynthetic protein FliR [Legionella sp.]|nr:flagellar biosynthetic protein FliR [Legionella sp.]
MIVSYHWLTDLFFITIRMGTLLSFNPIQAIGQLPVHTRFILIFSLSLLMVNYLPETASQVTETFLMSSLMEFANGLIFATSIFATFALFQIAGQLIDNATGFNSMGLFNPAEHTQEPLSSYLLTMLAVLFFFGMDGHIWFFKGILHSFLLIPPGNLNLFTGFAPVIKQFGFMFSMAFMIASPIVLALVAIELCAGVITRSMPQINTYLLTLPIKILLGLLLLHFMMGYLNPITHMVFEHCFNTWQQVMS